MAELSFSPNFRYEKHLESAFHFQTIVEGDADELMRDGSIWCNVFPNRKDEVDNFSKC